MPLHHIIHRWDHTILQNWVGQKHTTYPGFDREVCDGPKHTGNTQSQPLSLLGVCQVPLADTQSHQWSLHQLEVGILCCCALDRAFSKKKKFYLFLLLLFLNEFDGILLYLGDWKVHEYELPAHSQSWSPDRTDVGLFLGLVSQEGQTFAGWKLSV